MKTLSIIGAGNVATHLASALGKTSRILQIFSRDLPNAEKLCRQIGQGDAINSAHMLLPADAYIVAIKDDAIMSFLATVPNKCKNRLWVHTSGSIGRSVFNNFNSKNGVFYPLQTFSKNVPVDVAKVPFFIEGSSNEITEEIIQMALSISSHVYEADSELRMKMHVAAVFSCNFTNYMQIVAADILKRNNLPFSVLQPLIAESTQKIMQVAPIEAQTGPAARGDRNVIAKHLSLLSDTEKEIYETISDAILKRFKK